MSQSFVSVNADTFNKIAKSYDEKQYMVALADQVAAAVQHKLPLSSQTAVLEHGCGTGLLSERLAPNVGLVRGSDIATAMVDVYNQKAALKGLKNMKGVCVDVLNHDAKMHAINCGDLPRQYDLILVNMTAHHLDDVPSVLHSLSELLLPGGRLVLTDLLANDRSKQFHGKHAHHSVTHPGGFSEAQIATIMASAGLSLDSFDSSSLHITKPIEQEDGAVKPQDFGVFMAIARKV